MRMLITLAIWFGLAWAVVSFVTTALESRRDSAQRQPKDNSFYATGTPTPSAPPSTERPLSASALHDGPSR